MVSFRIGRMKVYDRIALGDIEDVGEPSVQYVPMQPGIYHVLVRVRPTAVGTEIDSLAITPNPRVPIGKFHLREMLRVPVRSGMLMIADPVSAGMKIERVIDECHRAVRRSLIGAGLSQIEELADRASLDIGRVVTVECPHGAGLYPAYRLRETLYIELRHEQSNAALDALERL